uniref:Uncharacterized protein n=1 Tax=Arundo donax TaxID=35708 RepID=A0A0A8XTD4_ARUDO
MSRIGTQTCVVLVPYAYNNGTDVYHYTSVKGNAATTLQKHSIQMFSHMSLNI